VSTGLAELGYNYVNIGIPLGSIQGIVASRNFFSYYFFIKKLISCLLLASSDDCWSYVKRGTKVPAIIAAFINPMFSKLSVNLCR
jgi:hypothetical protein